jgi:hypothetical protein
MYNPEYRYLIQQDNGDNTNWFEAELFAGIIVVGVNSAILFTSLFITLEIIKLSYKISSLFVIKLWSLLTPGNQWLELFLIFSSLLLFVIIFYIFYDLTNAIDNHFIKLKNSISEKEIKIRQLELDLKVRDSKLKKVEASLSITELEDWRKNMNEIFPDTKYMKMETLNENENNNENNNEK